MSERDSGLSLSKVVAELASQEQRTPVDSYARLHDFTARFEAATEGARYWALHDVCDTTGDSVLDGKINALALYLSATAPPGCVTWVEDATVAAPLSCPVDNSDVKALAKELEREGFRFLIHPDLRTARVRLIGTRLVALLGFAASVGNLVQQTGGLEEAATVGGVTITTLAFFGSFLWPDPGDTLRLLRDRLNAMRPAVARIGVTLPAMLGFVAFVFISTDAWTLFGSLSFTRVGILTGSFVAVALLVLLFRLARLNKRMTENTLAAKPSGEATTPLPPSTAIDPHASESAQIALKRLRALGVHPGGRLLTRRERFDLRIALNAVQIAQLVVAMLVLAAILLAFSYVVSGDGSVVKNGAGDFQVLWFHLSKAALKVVAVLCAVSGVFFAVVTLSNAAAQRSLVTDEHQRLEYALSVWEMYLPAYNLTHPRSEGA